MAKAVIGAVIGWDIGGAHVKAVLLDAHGCVQAVSQTPCALWKGLPLLEEAIQAVLAAFASHADAPAHVVTMTGELVDLFESRTQGVGAIADCVLRYLPQAQFYAADAEGVRLIDAVTGATAAVASMNWHASAACIAQQLPMDALVLDIGSTTTDVTLTDVTGCSQAAVVPAGWSDAERMAQGNLLYTGVVRTPLMALGPKLYWQEKPHFIAAEYFATMADVYRVLGQLAADHDMAETADGQDKSMQSSMRRLARMVGHDLEDRPQSAWLSLAHAFATQQQDIITQVCKQQLQQNQQLRQKQGSINTLVGLGAGAFLAPTIAQRLGLAYQPAQALITASNATLQHLAVVCFPAYAVARLRLSWD